MVAGSLPQGSTWRATGIRDGELPFRARCPSAASSDGSVSQVRRGRRTLAPHRGCAERSAVAAKSSSVDAVSVDQEQSSSVGAREAVVAATAVLQRTGRSDVPFGAERPADEAEFLAAIEELLVELTARRLRSNDVFAGVRAELPSLRDRLLQAALPLNGEGTHANRRGAPRDVG